MPLEFGKATALRQAMPITRLLDRVEKPPSASYPGDRWKWDAFYAIAELT
jgi:hypothetical protein